MVFQTINYLLAFLCSVPELADLVRELEDVNHWISFGLFLGIEMPKLEAIEIDCRTLGNCRIKMLNEWLKKVTPTWAVVVQTLVKIGMRRLASELAQKHGSLSDVFHTITIAILMTQFVLSLL